MAVDLFSVALGMKQRTTGIGTSFLIFITFLSFRQEINCQERLFEMEQIRDAATLEKEMIRDWYPVDGEVPTRQKFVWIRVGELWPGQDYRVPVRFIVPRDKKAKGFHLTGSHRLPEIEKDITPMPYEEELIAGEWVKASGKARLYLYLGLTGMIAGVIIIALGNSIGG